MPALRQGASAHVLSANPEQPSRWLGLEAAPIPPRVVRGCYITASSAKRIQGGPVIQLSSLTGRYLYSVKPSDPHLEGGVLCAQYL